MNSSVSVNEAYAVACLSLKLCLQSFEEAADLDKKKQLLIRAEELIADIESAIKIFCEEAMLAIENESDISSALLAKVHDGIAVAQLELFSELELRRLKRQRQMLTSSLFAQLSKIEIRLFRKVQRDQRLLQKKLKQTQAQIAALKETLNP